MNSKKRILLVEDDEFLAELYSTKLTLEGYEVVHAADGEKAVKIVGEAMPDLILLDVVLPKMDGFEVLRTIKGHKETKQIPVLS